MAEIEGVVKLFPVPIAAPPVAEANQLNVPADAVAPSIAVPESHIAVGVVDVIVGVAFAVATTAVLGDEHVAVAAST